MHRRLRRRPGRRPRSPPAPRACPSTSRRSSAPTAASSSSPTTATRSTATPATGRRPTPTARASAASGSWSRPAAARRAHDSRSGCMLYRVNAMRGRHPRTRRAADAAGLTQAAARRADAGPTQSAVAALERPGSNPTAAHARPRARCHRLRARRSARTRAAGRRREPHPPSSSSCTPAERLARSSRPWPAKPREPDARGRARAWRASRLSSDPSRLLAGLVDARRRLRRHRRRGGRPPRLSRGHQGPRHLLRDRSRPTSKRSGGVLIGAARAAARRRRGRPLRPRRRVRSGASRSSRSTTDAGDLDLLRRPSGARRYDELRGHADRLDVGGYRGRACVDRAICIAMKQRGGPAAGPRRHRGARGRTPASARAERSRDRSSARRAASRRSRASAASAATTSAAGASRASSCAWPAHRLIMSASPAARPAARRGAVTWWISG